MEMLLKLSITSQPKKLIKKECPSEHGKTKIQMLTMGKNGVVLS